MIFVGLVVHSSRSISFRSNEREEALDFRNLVGSSKGMDKVVEDDFDSNRGHKEVEGSDGMEDMGITEVTFYP